jgi:flagellin
LSRIVNQTRFNGEKILGSGFNGDFQVGAFVNETINVTINALSPTAMGVATNYSTVSGLTNAQLASRIAVSYNNALGGAATLEGTDLGAAVVSGTVSSTKIAQINVVTNSTGVTAFGYGNGLVGSTITTVGVTAAATDGITTGALTINGVTIGTSSASADGSNGGAADALVTAINQLTAQHGVTAVHVNDPTGGAATQGAIVLVNTTGAAITVTANNTVDAGITTFFANGTSSVSAGANGAIVLNDTLGDLTATYDTSTTGAALVGVSSSTTTLADAVVSAQAVTTAGSANLAMLVFEKALDTVNSARATIGAKLNRLEAVVRNLENVRENITAARGRIEDADFAEETARLTRAQILQQAGVAMVAQANQLPQTVLALLGQ